MYWVKGTAVHRPLVRCWWGVGEGEWSAVGPSLSVDLCPRTSHCVSAPRIWLPPPHLHFTHTPLGRTGWLEWAWGGYLPFSRSGRLWLSSFSQGQTLWRTGCSAYFKMAPLLLLLPPARAMRGFLSEIHCEAGWVSREKTHSSVGGPWWLGLPGGVNSQSSPHWPSSNLPVRFQVFLPQLGSQ